MSDDASARSGFDSHFADSLDRLVTLLRTGTDSGPRVEDALNVAVATVGQDAALLEAGVETSAGMEDVSLKGRLLARQVDTVRVESGVAPEELLTLARALVSDNIPLESSAHIKIELIPMAPPPPPTYGAPSASRATTQSFETPAGPRREGTIDNLAEWIASLTRGLTDGLQRHAIREALHAAQSLIRILPAVPEHSRRGVAISVRRYLSRPILETFLQFALRTPEEQTRATEVLKWAGLDGAEVMLEVVRQSEAVGPRGFLLESLGEMPEAIPLILPLLNSGKWHEVRHAAELAGRLRATEAVEALKAQVGHPDERVRTVVIEALARFPDKSVVEPLRQALAHRSPLTRAAAGRALASRGNSALAMPLLAAIEAEKDGAVFRELLGALSGLEAPEAITGLVRLATERKPLLGRGGHPVGQRLEVVTALAQANTPSARQALTRIAAEGDGPLRDAARKALATSE
jgi:hypothetical protein